MVTLRVDHDGDGWSGISARVVLDDRPQTATLALQGPDRAGAWSSCRKPGRSASPSCSNPGPPCCRGTTPSEPGVELDVRDGAGASAADVIVAAGAEPRAGAPATPCSRSRSLYGNDRPLEHSALESGLGWVCALDAKDFMGAQRCASRSHRACPSNAAFTTSQRGVRQGMPILPRASSRWHHVAVADVRHRHGGRADRGWCTGTPIDIDVAAAAGLDIRKPLYVKETST